MVANLQKVGLIRALPTMGWPALARQEINYRFNSCSMQAMT